MDHPRRAGAREAFHQPLTPDPFRRDPAARPEMHSHADERAAIRPLCHAQPVQPHEVVVVFADHLIIGLNALRSNSVCVGRRAIGEPLTFERESGQHTRSLSLPGVGTAQLHGRGCLIEFTSGAEVDFDWDQRRREVFDGWRLRQFARSIGQPVDSDDQLIQAMRSDERFMETDHGWFALVLLTDPV